MMEEIGGFLGWLIIIFYGLTILNFIVKAINKKYGKVIASNPNISKAYKFIMKIIVKRHRLFGYLTILFILTHFMIQYAQFGLNVTGIIAATVMILQVLLGVYGAYVNKKRAGAWFVLHRVIAVLLLITIGIHLVL